MSTWCDIETLAKSAPLAEGYRFELLTRAEVGPLIRFLETWYPDVSVGSASGYLRADFYRDQVQFARGPDRDVLVMLLKRGGELAGMFSIEQEHAPLSLRASLGVAAPQHRGANLACAGMALAEATARRLGFGLAYGMATLRAPHAQLAFERAGWQLIGITPGYDREMVTPGVVKRVFEAVYAKVLVPPSELAYPQLDHMTARAQALFRLLYPDIRGSSSLARINS